MAAEVPARPSPFVPPARDDHEVADAHGHSHGHGHDCSGHGILNHSHDYSSQASDPVARRALTLALWINVAFLIAEVVGGLVFNSVALLSDAAHMLMDVGALALALVAARMALMPSSSTRTYGFGRVETMAALANAVTLVLASLWIIYEATSRLMHPEHVGGAGVMVVAFGGLVANAVATWLLMQVDKGNINVRAAMMHSLMDALSSVGVLIAGGVILATGFTAIDPVASYLIAALSIAGTVGLVRTATNSLLDAAPESLGAEEVAKTILAHKEVTQVHDVHVWTIASNRHAATAHVLVRPGSDIGSVIEGIEAALRSAHGLQHVTLQVAHDRSRQVLQVSRRLSHPRRSTAPAAASPSSEHSSCDSHGHAHGHSHG